MLAGGEASTGRSFGLGGAGSSAGGLDECGDSAPAPASTVSPRLSGPACLKLDAATAQHRHRGGRWCLSSVLRVFCFQDMSTRALDGTRGSRGLQRDGSEQDTQHISVSVALWHSKRIQVHTCETPRGRFTQVAR